MKRYVLVYSLLLIPVLIFAQTADRIERLLEQESVSYAQAALLVLEASEHTALGSSPDEAFYAALEHRFLPKNAQADDTVNLMGLSSLVMRAFDMKGGLLYRLTGSQRHAYRELQRRGIVQGRVDPALPVSGEMLLFMVSRALFVNEGGQ